MEVVLRVLSRVNVNRFRPRAHRSSQKKYPRHRRAELARRVVVLCRRWTLRLITCEEVGLTKPLLGLQTGIRPGGSFLALWFNWAVTLPLNSLRSVCAVRHAFASSRSCATRRLTLAHAGLTRIRGTRVYVTQGQITLYRKARECKPKHTPRTMDIVGTEPQQKKCRAR